MRIQYAASAATYSAAAGETRLNDPLVHPRERTLAMVQRAGLWRGAAGETLP